MKIGIFICDRYKTCAGGKCFRAVQNREGAFSIYSKDTPLEVVGYTSCGGCPGGNIEYAPEEMIKTEQRQYIWQPVWWLVTRLVLVSDILKTLSKAVIMFLL